MEIIDRNGKKIIVTDLNKAIGQAALFRGFKHLDTDFEEFDKKQNIYWQDVYKKLLALKKSSDEHNIF